MARNVWMVGGVLALGALCAGGTPGGLALAGGEGRGPLEKDECVYTAHGSPAAEHQNDRAGHGSGGGKNTTCSKTFAKWRKASATLNVYVDGQTLKPSSISSTDFLACAQYSFEQWACNSGLGSYTFNWVGSATGADITISWGDLGATGILGQTQTWYSGGVISHSDIQMNTNAAINWVLTGSNVPTFDATACVMDLGDSEVGNTASSNYDFVSVLLHEIGHSLGVSHPNRRCASFDTCYPQTMYSCTDAEEWFRRSLDTGDLTSIVSLYGQ